MAPRLKTDLDLLITENVERVRMHGRQRLRRVLNVAEQEVVRETLEADKKGERYEFYPGAGALDGYLLKAAKGELGA